MLNSESKFVVTTTALLEKVKEATKDLKVRIIVIGDNEDKDCVNSKTVINNTGDLING